VMARGVCARVAGRAREKKARNSADREALEWDMA
jgi:hypothetical protein